jgi:hypothetical protein
MQEPVQVIGKSLFVNGEPFTVKDVGTAPIPIGHKTASSD